MALVPCTRCKRHVRIQDRSCPFCANVVGAFLGLSLLVSCKSTESTGANPSLAPASSVPDGQKDSGGLGALSEVTTGQAAVYGSPPDRDSPRAKVSVETPGASTADTRIVSAMVPGMRACAQRAVNGDPEAAGKAKLELRVGADGQVVSAKELGHGSLPASEVSCMLARATGSRFETGSARTISVEVTHTTKK